MTDSQHATQLALQRYLDNETTVAESSAIQQHLSTCSTCASAIAESARLKRAVSLHANRYQPSSDFRQRIAAQLAPAPARRPEIRMRQNSKLPSRFKLIWVVQSPRKKYFA